MRLGIKKGVIEFVRTISIFAQAIWKTSSLTFFDEYLSDEFI